MKYPLGLVLIGVLAAGNLPAAPKAPQTLTLEQRVDLMERKQRAMSDLMIRIDALQREVQQLRGEVELQGYTLDAMKKRQRDLYLDIDQRLGAISRGEAAQPTGQSQVQQPGQGQTAVDATGTAPVASSTTASTPVANAQPQPAPVADASQAPAVAAQPAQTQSPTPQAAGDPALEESSYQKAFDLLMQGRYADARSGFQAFLAAYPASRLAGNAQYWLGESNYVTRDFDTALADFAKVIDLYPQSTKVADAKLKSGFIHYEQKRWAEARNTLQSVVDDYPGSTAARLAAQRLQRMSGEGR